MLSRATIENWVTRDERRLTNMAAVAIRADGTSCPVKLRNISYQGCMLELDTVLSIGERVTLALPRMGEVKTQIRWATADGRAGVRFLTEEFLAEEPHSRLGL